LIFLEAELLDFIDTPVPLSVQMLRLFFNTSASGSITTAIGAKLELQLGDKKR